MGDAVTHTHRSQRPQQGKDQKEANLKENKTGELGSIPSLRRSPGEGNGSPLQYSCLENPMDRGAWWATVHGVAKSQTRLNDFHTLIIAGLFGEMHPPHTDSEPSQKAGVPRMQGWLVFMGLGPLPTFWLFVSSLRTVMGLVGVSFRC